MVRSVAGQQESYDNFIEWLLESEAQEAYEEYVERKQREYGILAEKKKRDDMIEVGTFPKLDKYVVGGGPIFVSRGILIKLKKYHRVGNGVGFIRSVLDNYDFAKQYMDGIFNFYHKFINTAGVVHYRQVGVSVVDKVVTTAFSITPTAYKKAYEQRRQ